VRTMAKLLVLLVAHIAVCEGLIPHFAVLPSFRNPFRSARGTGKDAVTLTDPVPESEKMHSARRALVAEYMSKNVVTLQADMPLDQASCVLAERGITGCPVVEGDGGSHLVGMLSQTDLLYKAAGSSLVPLKTRGAATVRYEQNTRRLNKAMAADVRSAMTSSVLQVSPTTSMAEAAAVLLRNKVSRLPVTNSNGDLVGIVTATDVMQLLVADPEGCIMP